MATRYLFVLLTGLSLGDCCLSGSGCGVATTATTYGSDLDGFYAAQEHGPPVGQFAWQQATRKDRPTIQSQPASTAERKNNAREEEWAQERAEEARLTRQLAICRDCSTGQ